MFESNRTIAGVGRVAAIFLGAISFAAVLPCGGFAAAQKATKPSTSQEASPKQIQELMTLLADPKVRNWLEEQSKAEAASERAATEQPVSQVLDSRLAAIREHIVALAGTVPDLPTSTSEVTTSLVQTSVNTAGPRPCCFSRVLWVWAPPSNGYFARRRNGTAPTSMRSPRRR